MSEDAVQPEFEFIVNEVQFTDNVDLLTFLDGSPVKVRTDRTQEWQVENQGAVAAALKRGLEPPTYTAPVERKRCSSCNKHLPLDEFDGKATCNHCRPKKRKKQSETRKTLEELDSLRPKVDSLKAALKQKTDEVEVIKKQRDRLEQEVNFLRSLHSGLAHAAISVFKGGAQSPGAPESAQFSLPDPSVTEGGSTAATRPERDGSSTESANGNGSGAGTLIHECAVDADEGSLVVAPDNAKLTRMVTFENMELEEAYQFADNTRTRSGLKCVATLFLMMGILYGYMVPLKKLLFKDTISVDHKGWLVNHSSEGLHSSPLEMMVGQPVEFCGYLLMGLATLCMSSYHGGVLKMPYNQKNLLTALFCTVLPFAFLWSHVNEGRIFRTMLADGENVYGLKLGDLDGGKQFTEHMAIINWSNHLTQMQIMVQFMCAVMLDVRHSVVVMVTMVLVNAAIFATGDYVDYNDPVQFMSAGFGVHRCIVFKSLWSLAVGLIALALTARVDSERRLLWLASYTSHH